LNDVEQGALASAKTPPASEGSALAQNVEFVADLHARTRQELRNHRAVELLGEGLGRPRVLYALLVVLATWIGGNETLKLTGRAPLDPPPFFWLQGAIALTALVVTLVLLISQNRLAQLSEQRAHLDLQVNLLAERKIAKLIELVEELRRDLPSVVNRRDAEAESMQIAADPGAVLDAVKASLLEDRSDREEK
jgi:uncharacterized membrane protein